MSSIPQLGNEMRIRKKISRILYSLPFLGFMIFLFAVAFPPLDDATTVNLSIHMGQHFLIALGGALIGYPLYRAGTFSAFKSQRTGWLGLALVSALLIFWHIPSNWDAAVLNPAIHAVEHLSFLVAGFLIGGFLPMLSDNAKLLVLMMAISAHMFYGFTLFLINTQVYPIYPISQQATLGVLLFAPSPIYLVGALYLNISKEAKKLDHESSIHLTQEKHKSKSLVVPILSIILIAVLVGYFAVTFVSIGTVADSQQGNTSIVYVKETPFTWQFSPQDIVVKIGVNNTVVWKSESISYDTVTSNTGLFSSPPIAPGQSFTFTFNETGTFEYHCIYHPWMIGNVTVID